MSKKLLSAIVATSIYLVNVQALMAADDKALPPPGMGEKTTGPVTNNPPAVPDNKVPNPVPKPDEIPEVSITLKPQTIVEEFRVKGKLRYIKITPTKGKPYYLFDSDGDGQVDALETGIDKARVNQWILMEF